MADKTKTEEKSQKALWKEEIESLKSQKTNKSLSPKVIQLIQGEIEILEERLKRWDEVSQTLRETEEKIEKLSEKLSELRKTQKESQIFLGVTTESKPGKRKSKFNLEEVVGYIKHNNGKRTYEEISNFTKVGVQTVKKQIEGNPTVFKIDSSTRPHSVGLK